MGGESHETVWKGWQAAEEYRNGTLAQRRVFGLTLDEIVQLQVDTNGDGHPDQSYAPLYDETGNVVAMTGANGKPIERYEYSPYGEQKIFVDSTPPVVEQVRVKGNAVWLEISEEVSAEAFAEALAAQRVTLTHVGNGQGFLLQVTQPVTSGRLARRRIVLTPTSPPVAGTQVRLSVGAEALQDLFLNQPSGARPTATESCAKSREDPMSSQWVTFRYRDFYDVPRAMLVEFAGILYFFDCPFSQELDDYEEAYSVYRVPDELRGEIDSASWIELPRHLSFVGSVAVDAVQFDSTKRHSIAARVFEQLAVPQ